jgi:hypothetical protein
VRRHMMRESAELNGTHGRCQLAGLMAEVSHPPSMTRSRTR